MIDDLTERKIMNKELFIGLIITAIVIGIVAMIVAVFTAINLVGEEEKWLNINVASYIISFINSIYI